MESGNENAHRLVSGCTIREEGLGVVRDSRTWSFRYAAKVRPDQTSIRIRWEYIYIYIFYVEVRCCLNSKMSF